MIAQGATPMESQQYLSTVKRWWWLMVACVAVATGSNYHRTTQMPRIYQATATVMVGQTMEQVNPSSADLTISRQLAQTYAELVKRRPILKGAAEALGLVHLPSPDDVAAEQVQGTQLLEISVRDTHPERARALADEIANQLILKSPSAGQDQEHQAFVKEQLADLETKIVTTEGEIEAEREKLEAGNTARSIQQRQANVDALEQKLGAYQSTYATLVRGIRGATNYISIVERASTPEVPISPDVQQTLLLAGAIGLMLSIGGASLIEFLDDTIKTSHDVRRTVDLPTLGAVARIDGDDYWEKLISVRAPRSPIVEAYRALRTNIQFSSMHRPTRALMVTSASLGDGKSVTLANLAVLMAQSGLRVIAVDSDLRRPALHRIFNGSNEPGLGEAILNTKLDRDATDLSAAVSAKDPTQPMLRDSAASDGAVPRHPNVAAYLHPTEVDNLWLLPSGRLPPNPVDLLGSKRMADLVQELKGQADLLLFDSSPVLAVNDAAVLSTQVDGVLLVFDTGRTRREMAEKSVEELHRVGAHLLGVVLNSLSRHGHGHYYRYYHGSRDGASQERRPTRQARWLGRRLPRGGRASDAAEATEEPPTEAASREAEVDRERHKP